MSRFTSREMMIVALSRLIRDNKAYIVGTGLPFTGATLAKNTHAPNCHLIFESGLFESNLQELPRSVGDLRNCYESSVLWPQYRYYGFQVTGSASGKIDCGFLGGAQIDPYGNLNSMCIGDYHHPKARFSGSGGANGIATFCDTIIIMKHEKRRFAEHVDYITCPGWIDGPDGREKSGLNPDCGPRAVVTDLGVFRFGDDKRMYLAEYFPGITPQQVLDNTAFDMDVSRAVEAEEPSEGILKILRERVEL